MKEIILIASVSKNGVIGKDGNQQIFIKADLKRFKELTENCPVIMGRVTFEAILNKLKKPLPNRTNIIVSSNPEFAKNFDCIVCSSINEAIEKAKNLNDEIFVIGGAKIFKQTIDFADRLEITKFNIELEGDVYFPIIDEKKWTLQKQTEGIEKDLKFSFQTYIKKTVNG